MISVYTKFTEVLRWNLLLMKLLRNLVLEFFDINDPYFYYRLAKVDTYTGQECRF